VGRLVESKETQILHIVRAVGADTAAQAGEVEPVGMVFCGSDPRRSIPFGFLTIWGGSAKGGRAPAAACVELADVVDEGGADQAAPRMNFFAAAS